MRYRAIIEYRGTNYNGMQKQKDSSIKTIQGEIEKAISKFANENIEIDYSGRTDKGVHALGQVIHFDLQKNMDEYKVLHGINFYLTGEEIVIKKVDKVDNNFHSRFSAKSRKYLYRVLNTPIKSPLLATSVYHYRYNLDMKKMNDLIDILIGKKMDFSAFCNDDSVNNVNTLKTLNKIQIIKKNEEIHFIFEAKSFLHNMIRIMVGVFLEVGRGKITKEDVISIINSKKRSDKCTTAPACGLYFLETIY